MIELVQMDKYIIQKFLKKIGKEDDILSMEEDPFEMWDTIYIYIYIYI